MCNCSTLPVPSHPIPQPHRDQIFCLQLRPAPYPARVLRDRKRFLEANAAAGSCQDFTTQHGPCHHSLPCSIFFRPGDEKHRVVGKGQSKPHWGQLREPGRCGWMETLKHMRCEPRRSGCPMDEAAVTAGSCSRSRAAPGSGKA